MGRTVGLGGRPTGGSQPTTRELLARRLAKEEVRVPVVSTILRLWIGTGWSNARSSAVAPGAPASRSDRPQRSVAR
jgi:hypothetical protein